MTADSLAVIKERAEKLLARPAERYYAGTGMTAYAVPCGCGSCRGLARDVLALVERLEQQTEEVSKLEMTATALGKRWRATSQRLEQAEAALRQIADFGTDLASGDSNFKTLIAKGYFRAIPREEPSE